MTKRKAGRPPYEPTDKDRRVVVSMVAAGIEQREIARALGITAPTLRRHFRTELDTGESLMLAEVTRSLFDMATGAKGPPNVTAAIFIMKARGGWSDQGENAKLGKKEQQQQEAKEATENGPYKPRKPPGLQVVKK